jgi:hypothetical protein
MTREEVQKLSNEDLNRLIAKHGGVDCEEYPLKFSKDFNAIRKVERLLLPEQWIEYICHCVLFDGLHKDYVEKLFVTRIREYCIKNFGVSTYLSIFYNMCGAFYFVFLSPRQRAEALAMVLTEVDGA